MVDVAEYLIPVITFFRKKKTTRKKLAGLESFEKKF
jgi:hypothetical protein